MKSFFTALSRSVANQRHSQQATSRMMMTQMRLFTAGNNNGGNNKNIFTGPTPPGQKLQGQTPTGQPQPGSQQQP